MNTCNNGKLLGRSISSNGLLSHNITGTINKGSRVLSQLRRFRNLSPKIKTTLIKTLLIPVLEYPPIPICTVSLTQKRNIQTVLNKAVRFIHCNEPEQMTTEELHIKYNITPLNISTHQKAKNIWETIKICEPDQFQDLTHPYNNTHTWFPKSSTIINLEPPQAIITRQH